MSQTAQQATTDATKEDVPPNNTAVTAQSSATTLTSTQRVFRVYKPLGGRSAGGKKARMGGVGARAKKSGFFADRFERFVRSLRIHVDRSLIPRVFLLPALLQNPPEILDSSTHVRNPRAGCRLNHRQQRLRKPQRIRNSRMPVWKSMTMI